MLFASWVWNDSQSRGFGPGTQKRKEHTMYKVIIADDEKLIRNGLKNILDWETLGFEVDGVFSDGEEVLDYLDYSVPDAILTDVKMANVPNVKGLDYELARGQLNSRGFFNIDVEMVESDEEKNTVVDISVTEGDSMDVNTQIILYLYSYIKLL